MSYFIIFIPISRVFILFSGQAFFNSITLLSNRFLAVVAFLSMCLPQFCLGMMQRLITQQVVDQKGARYITDALWMLMEHNIEEVKVLQTITLLLTTNTVVHGDTLAKSLVLCFRLHYTKNSTIVNTAGATIRQLVSLVFERVYLEKDSLTSLQQRDASGNVVEIDATDTSITSAGGNSGSGAGSGVSSLSSSGGPSEMSTFASDAFLLFQVCVMFAIQNDEMFSFLSVLPYSC